MELPAKADQGKIFFANPSQLEKIVLSAVGVTFPGSKKMTEFSVGTEGQPPDSRGYYLFSVDFNSQESEGSNTLESFFVSGYDGQIWEASLCQKITSENIKFEQDKLTGEFRKSGYQILKGRPPKCDDDR
jgi:hypothetical protein